MLQLCQMAFIYTQSQLLSDINRKIFGKIGMISSQEDFINEVARTVNNDVSIRSTRRKMPLSTGLFPMVYQYPAPTDLRDYKIIDIPPQAKDYDDTFTMIPSEQFHNRKRLGDVAIEDYNGVRTLLINSEIPTGGQVISELDTLGTWEAFGGVENVAQDSSDYIKGSGAITFDISSASDTTAGIVNTDINEFSLADYLGGDSAVFVWARINTPTDLTNYILRLGTDASNYYSKTATVAHDGNAFVAGWNLIRFDLTNLTEQGTVTDASINYAAIYMTKTTGKVDETDYKFDWLLLNKGYRHNITYVSKYSWQSETGVYKEKSTESSDLIVADTSEYDLFVLKGRQIGLEETGAEQGMINTATRNYVAAMETYMSNNPDESMIMVTSYQEQQ